MKEKVFCDISLCLGCKSCELACAVEHSESRSLFEAVFEELAPRTRKKVQAVSSAGERAIAVSCGHCETAQCVIACMAGAMFKDEDGKTVHNPEKCVGCGMCIMVCPLGVITRQKNLILKCDMCPDLDKRYACVDACQTGALFAGTAEEFEKRLKKRREKVK
ncbi:4Fe-4S dicluster domain-containing protein [candidate division KSB1 bacterium]